MIVNDSLVGGRRPTGLLTSLRSFRRLGAALGLRGSGGRAGVETGWGCDLNLAVMVGSSIETRAPLHVDIADDGLTGARPAKVEYFEGPSDRRSEAKVSSLGIFVFRGVGWLVGVGWRSDRRAI